MSNSLSGYHLLASFVFVLNGSMEYIEWYIIATFYDLSYAMTTAAAYLIILCFKIKSQMSFLKRCSTCSYLSFHCKRLTIQMKDFIDFCFYLEISKYFIEIWGSYYNIRCRIILILKWKILIQEYAQMAVIMLNLVLTIGVGFYFVTVYCNN